MPWNQVGTSFDVSCLATKTWGQKPPPEEQSRQEGNILKQTDVGVARVVHKNGGLGLPWSFLFWHWGMIVVFFIFFSTIWVVQEHTKPAAAYNGTLISHLGLDGNVAWYTMAQKLIVFWYVWESLGLGVIHGPMHGKMSPPFTDWWYRMTPGTIKYRAPFLPDFTFFNRRNWFDVLVEVPLTYGLAIWILTSPDITPKMVWPLFGCALYEFFFDYGQHMHTYGTQTLHVFFCMCFPLSQGQIVGIQLFWSWFYACSGWCKIGPWFKYLNVNNLTSAKFMVDVPWAGCFRWLMYKDHDNQANPDYNLTTCAAVFSTICALLETLGPALCLLSWNENYVLLGIFLFMCMHVYIIFTLIVDVFTWNFVDAMYYCIMFGCISTGLRWQDVATMSPYIKAWLVCHALYTLWGNFVPSHVPYVVAHRHAAGNFCQGMLLIKPEAAGKLGKLKAHAGLPKAMDPMDEQGMRWLGQWLAVHLLVAYFWLWNLPSRMLTPLIHYQLKGDSMNNYVMIHSVLLFDALVAHVRFDGLSSLQLVEELGKVCEFEPGECVLCWCGAFQSFPVWPLTDPTAKWCIKDSNKGVIKEGLMKVSDVQNADYKKPSDCKHLLKIIEQTESTNNDMSKPLLA